ncbi:hypothetical protein M218_25040 [Burkholderia pseudomallei MSHR338]|nr:hypothetical protein M218_25040 [Burkholderia pseudomallei MSHR338]
MRWMSGRAWRRRATTSNGFAPLRASMRTSMPMSTPSR